MRAHFRGWFVGLGAIATVVMAAIAAAGGSSPAFATIGACSSTSSVGGGVTTETIVYSDADCTWTVPDGVTSATFKAFGAQGGSAYDTGPTLNAAGGDGGEAIGTFNVTPGNTWTIGVGGQGTDYTDGTGTAGAGGFGGGGSGYSTGGAGGGGATIVTDPTNNVAVVAGGGGGANFGAPGGWGGGSVGGSGCPISTQCSTTNSGKGGTSIEGGTGESANPNNCVYVRAGNGTGPAAGTVAGSGGGGGNCDLGVGPGGGGGYYGGGGGVFNGGGGGSGYVASSAVTYSLPQFGNQTGNGVLTIAYTANDTSTVITSNYPNGVDLTGGDVTATYTATVTTTTGNSAVTVGAVTFTDVGSGRVLCGPGVLNSNGQATCGVPYSMSATEAWLAPGHHTIEAAYADSTNTYVASKDKYDAPVGEPPSYSPDSHTIDVTIGVPMTTYTIPAPTCSPSCGLSVSTPAISGLTGTQNDDNTFSVSGTPGSGTYGSYTWKITAGNDLAPDAVFTLTINVQLEGTDTNLSYSGTPTYGMPQTLTATVTANDASETLPPAGTIYFKNFIYQLCSGALTPVSPATTPPSATVTCDLTTRSAGAYNFQAELQPSADFQSATASNVISKTISPAGTSTSVVLTTPSSGTPAYGQPVTFTATVTPTDVGTTLTSADINEGTVTFTDATTSTPLCSSVAVSGGQAVCALSTSSELAALTAGAHNIEVSYSDSGNFSGSDNSASELSQQINAAATTTSLALTSPSAGTPAYGQPVTFTATVSASSPSVATVDEGTVTFTDTTTNTTLCTAKAVSGGTATCALPAGLTVGTHDIEAVYSDGNSPASFSGSDNSASELSQQIDAAATVTSLVLTSPATGNPVYGQPMTFTATVTPSDAGTTLTSNDVNEGTVAFTGDGHTIGCDSVAVNGGEATCTLSNANDHLKTWYQGTHVFTAAYSDGGTSPSFSGSDSTANPLSVEIDHAPLSGTLVMTSPGGGNPVYGQPITFTATVSVVVPSTINPTGDPDPLGGSGLSFYLDNSALPLDGCGGALVPGATIASDSTLTCSLGASVLAGLTPGAHTISFVYPGYWDYNPIQPVLDFTVAAAPTTTSASASVFNNATGLLVDMTAVVTANSPATINPNSEGTVTFSDSQGTLCTVALTGNQATCETTAITPGGGQITAAYSGDASFSPSSTTTDAGPAAGPVITSVAIVDDPSLLIEGAGFTATSSVTVCGVAVPFTTISSGALLAGIPSQAGTCTVTVTTPNGTASAQVTLPPTSVPGAPVNVGPGGSTAGSTPPAGCNDDTLALAGQWTLVAWPGVTMPPAQALGAAADGCTTDISAKVSVIWAFDAVAQTWQAFFPGATTPGANDLTELQQGMGYFVGLVDTSQPVSWSVEVGS